MRSWAGMRDSGLKIRFLGAACPSKIVWLLIDKFHRRDEQMIRDDYWKSVRPEVVEE